MFTFGMVFVNTLDQKHCFSALNSLVMTLFYLNQTPSTAFGETLYLCYCHLPPFDRFKFYFMPARMPIRAAFRLFRSTVVMRAHARFTI